MSNLNRLRALHEFCETEPDNPFNWYALALEYQEHDPEKTSELFNKLLLEHPDYLPTYYPAAHFFSDQDDIEKALDIFEKGISLAKIQGETKTLNELSSALEMLKFENDLD
ncbi:tetratricopeptide repeat protein [Algoriphagus sediminis]|uniref:tetratricopeptide repeat protein n=1 Tax=Algoriphagus sediminis TaxID=3057113 RepID=UPI0025B20C6F|nr:tetratricopeptide repeat protein [Algoriphagus sediminis]